MRAVKFNEMIKWSNLARLAGGNVPKLTIVAPFIAFIILHNEPLQPVLQLSNNRHPNPLVEYLALARFDIFYLGLIIVGIAVSIFTVFAPSQIVEKDGYDGYIDFKERTKTANGIAGSLRLTLERFGTERKDGPPALDERAASARFPRRFREGLQSLLEAVVRDAPFAADYSGAGDALRTDRALDVLSARRPEDRDQWQALFGGLMPFSIDVYRLEYLCADYSAPRTRAIVFWLLILGTAIVLIPTVITTFLVISDLFSAGVTAVEMEGSSPSR